MNSNEYSGNELELFQTTRNWKEYFSKIITARISGHVLEVGAGIGATTEALYSEHYASWTCLEPDPSLASKLRVLLAADQSYINYSVITGDIYTLTPAGKYDAILYVDVLEHIQKDAEELNAVSGLLKEGGKLVILSPAHQWLYSEFDRSIGHFRRYNRTSLTAVIPQGYRPLLLRYLDTVGVLASLANRLLLRRENPTTRQIAFWDRIIVPASRLIDPLLGYRVGKTILGIWQKQ